MPELGCATAVAATHTKQTADNQFTEFMSGAYAEGGVNCQTTVESLLGNVRRRIATVRWVANGKQN